MNPTMSITLLLLIGAVNGDSTIVTVEQSITPSFTNGDVDGIEVNCGDHCQVTDDDKWFLSAQKSDKIEDWAIEVDLSDAFALSSGLSKISFTIEGERVNGEADMFMGFGDGDQYISFSTDFDGMMSSGYYSGVIVYPPCGSPLAAGSVSDILSNSQQYASNAGIAVRHALADGDRSEWRQFGGERHNNGNSWPVTIEIENDEDEDTVTLRFTSENSGDDDLSTGSVECVYTGTFAEDQFTFGILPDLGNGDKDDFHIDSIDIEVASTGENLNPCPRTTDYEYCPAFVFDDEPLGACPSGWTCVGTAKVQTCDHYLGDQDCEHFLSVGYDGASANSVTSDYFPVPADAADIAWLRSGGAEEGGVRVEDVNGNIICEVRDGTNTNQMFEQSCALDGYAGQCIRIHGWDAQNSQWGKVYVDKFQFRDSTQSVLESTCEGDLPTMAPSLAPSLAPTLAPSPAPSKAPSPAPSVAPSLAPSTGPAYEEVYGHPGAIQPEQDVPLMYIDIVEEMHFEMDITVHSLLSHYKKFFQCTDGGDYTKVLYIQTHHDGQLVPKWTTADSIWGTNTPKKGIVAGETYHLEMDMAPGSWTVTLDGVVVYDRTELGDPLTLENIPCYIFSNSINGGADVTVSNLFIGVPEGPSYHYIAPGDYINDWNDHPESEWAICQEDSSNQAPVSGYFGYDIAVGCCEVDSSKGVRPDCDALAKTYDEAVQICEENGHRLCTLDEMLWQRRTNDKGCHFDRAYNWVSTECVPTDPSLNAAANSMSVEGENGSEHDSAQKPMDDMNPIALTLIGAVVVVVIALLFVMMRGRTKKEQTAKETVAEMSEVVDAPKVVHVADDTVEAPTETAVAEPSMPETTVNGMEVAVEVKVNTESV